MEEKRKSDRVKNAMCFFPLVAFIIYFIEKDKTERLKKNMLYAVILFLLCILLPIFTIFSFWFIFILYILFSIFLWYKSYLWEDLDFEFLNNIFLKK